MAKKIPCPQCKSSTGGERYMPANKKTNPLTDLSGFFGATMDTIMMPIRVVNEFLRGNQQPYSSVQDKECSLCNGTGEIEDGTDLEEGIKKAEAEIKASQDEIQKLEAELTDGIPGGNRHTLILGNEMLEVGVGMNDSPSYKTVEDGSAAPSGVEVTKKGVVDKFLKTTAIAGINPIATLGGNYTIKCSNKFTLFTGAQGIELDTYGPVTIGGGITRIIGPEVTVGTSKGATIIEGESLRMAGKTISLEPRGDGDGHVNVRGTLSTTGNINTMGGAHIEGDLSFISATCPQKVENTKMAGNVNLTTGPAQWSMQCTMNGIIDLVRKVTARSGSSTNFLLSPRGMQYINDEMISMMKKTMPIDMVQSGIAIGVMPGPSIAPVYSFPHHHALPDDGHTHSMVVPNINTMKDSDEVRQSSGIACNSRAPQSANTKEGFINKALQSIVNVITMRISP
jgi:hypothetical protein